MTLLGALPTAFNTPGRLDAYVKLLPTKRIFFVGVGVDVVGVDVVGVDVVGVDVVGVDVVGVDVVGVDVDVVGVDVDVVGVLVSHLAPVNPPSHTQL